MSGVLFTLKKNLTCERITSHFANLEQPVVSIIYTEPGRYIGKEAGGRSRPQKILVTKTLARAQRAEAQGRRNAGACVSREGAPSHQASSARKERRDRARDRGPPVMQADVNWSPLQTEPRPRPTEPSQRTERTAHIFCRRRKSPACIRRDGLTLPGPLSNTLHS